MNQSKSTPCISAVVAALFSVGCIGVSQPKMDASAPSDDALAACPGGLLPAADGNIDDFEDGNQQGTPEGGRSGSWYLSADSSGSAFTTPAAGYATAEGGADGSTTSLHVAGKTVAGDPSAAWGVEIGLNFLETGGEFYDASKYKAFFFKAKLGSKTADKSVRVSLTDVNTHPSGTVCTTCYNHFNNNIELTPDWKEYTLAFEDLRQRDGWGAPRPPRLTPEKLVSLNYQVGGAVKEFDMWIDDLKFLECKK